MASSSSSSSSSLLEPLCNSSLLEPLCNSSQLASTTRNWTWTYYMGIFGRVFVSVYAILFAYVYLIGHTPTVAVFNIRQFHPPSPPSPPSSLPLPVAYSVIREDCSPCLHENPKCVETLASIPSTTYARSTSEVMAIAVAKLFNITIEARSELFDMAERVRKNTKDHAIYQYRLVRFCAKETDKILDYRFEENAAVLRQPETLGGFIDSVLLHGSHCFVAISYDEPEGREEGGFFETISGNVSSVLDPIEQLGEICSCIVNHKQIGNLKLQELNLQPLMLLTGDRYGEPESPGPRPPVGEYILSLLTG